MSTLLALGLTLAVFAMITGSGSAQDKPATLLAAHRGGAALWPENSLLAFRNAIALGSDLIEFEVHLTAGGGVAVIHDATLGRTTDGRGAVESMTADDLRRVHLKGPGGAATAEP